MNVLFVRPSSPFVHPSSFNEKSIPIGIGFLSSALKSKGVNVFLIDRYLNSDYELSIEYLLENDIDCICLSLDSITISDGISLLRRIKYLNKTGKWRGRVVCGGPHVSYYPEDVEGLCDCVVIGEGDHCISDAILSNKAIIRSPRIEDLDALPIPDYALLLTNKYNSNFVSDYAINISTSRGCPYSCSYCSSNGIWGNFYAYLSAERVYEIMCYLNKNYKYTHFVFREDNFIVNKKRIIDLCDLITKNNKLFTWDCEARADSLLDNKFNNIMKSGILKTVFVGMESVDDSILNLYNKKITKKEILDSINMCKASNIDVFGSFIVGTPYDDGVSMGNARNFAEKHLDRYKLNVFIGLPRSPLYDYCIDFNIYDFYDEPTRTFYCKNYNDIVLDYVLNPGERLFPWRSSPAAHINSIDNINNKSCNYCIPSEVVLVDNSNYSKVYEIIVNLNSTVFFNNIMHMYEEDEIDFLLSEIIENKFEVILRTIIINIDIDNQWERGCLYVNNFPCKFLITNKFIQKYSKKYKVKIVNLNKEFSDIYFALRDDAKVVRK